MPRLLTYLFATLLLLPPSLLAQSTTAPQTTPDHDGQHDFDFEFGVWQARLKRLVHPLSGSNTWVNYEGTSTVRKVWDGRANLGELAHRRHDHPLIQPRNASVEPALGQQPRRRTRRSPHHRMFQERPRRIFRSGRLSGENNPRAFRLLRNHARVLPHRAIFLARRRKNLGSQLDRDLYPQIYVATTFSLFLRIVAGHCPHQNGRTLSIPFYRTGSFRNERFHSAAPHPRPASLSRVDRRGSVLEPARTHGRRLVDWPAPCAFRQHAAAGPHADRALRLRRHHARLLQLHRHTRERAARQRIRIAHLLQLRPLQQIHRRRDPRLRLQRSQPRTEQLQPRSRRSQRAG